jgi:prepilin-type N-terminal cleavage/methylation domain-containing protein
VIAALAQTSAAGENCRVHRRAFTLLEVLTALAIFLVAISVFASIFVRNSEIAVGIQQQNLATRLCQSKMHEVAAGVVPLSSDGDQPFDEEPNYTWSLQADSGPADGLWKVTVTVKRVGSDSGDASQCSLTQLVLDPSTVGSNEDVVPVTSSTTTGGSSASSSSSSGSSSTTGSSTTGAAASPAAAPAPAGGATSRPAAGPPSGNKGT